MSKKSTIFQVDKFAPSPEFEGAYPVEESTYSKNHTPFSCRQATIELSAYPDVKPVYDRLNKRSKSYTIPEKVGLYNSIKALVAVELPPISNFVDIYPVSDGQGYKAVVIKFW